MSLFQPASREQLRARIAFDGPTGSGKTWSMLAWARTLAGPDGRIAVVDTERGSASLYSDRFEFDVLNWTGPYDPRKLVDVLLQAEADGYDVICVDSLTHFWKGEGGTIDIADAAGKRSGGNSFAGWKVATPALRGLIDTMLGLDSHFLCTMRSKMEHILVENSRGKLEPTKVGMQPEMRADIEYEFTLVLSMDLDHMTTVAKSRYEDLADQVIRPGETNASEAAEMFLRWLREGKPQEPPAAAETIAAIRQWLNSLPAEEGMRTTVRENWPVGVPELGDRRFSVSHAERIVDLVRGLAGEPPADVAALLPGGPEAAPEDVEAADTPDDAPDGADED